MIDLGGDSYVEWDAMKDKLTGAFVNGGATVTGQLLDTDESTIGTVSFSYVPGSNGRYLGLVTAAMSAELVQGTTYDINVTATYGGRTAYRVLHEIADYRGAY